MRSIFKKRNLLGFLSLLLLCTLLIKSTKPEVSLTYDSRTKSIQTHALIYSHFGSEELPYPAKSIDPKEEFLPMPANNYTKLGESTISVFPILHAALATPFYYLAGNQGLPYFNLLGVFIFLWILRKFWKASNTFIALAFFGSYLPILMMEFAEHTLFVAILLASLTFLYKRNGIYAGIFAGLSIWFRHEGIVFAGCILFASWISEGFPPFSKNVKLKKSQSFRFGLGFAFIFLVFVIFNYLRYSSLLGPRFHANYGETGVGFTDKIQWAIGFLFLNKIDETVRIGFFTYIPFALIGLGILLYNIRKISVRKKTIVLGAVFFLFTIPFLAPNYGFWEWGPRYLSAGIPPVTLVLYWFWNYFARKKKVFLQKSGFGVLIAIPVIMTFIGISFLNQSRKQLLKTYTLFHELKADTLVFHDFSVMYFIGNDYLSKNILCVPKEGSLSPLLQTISQKEKGKRIALIQIKEELITPEKLEKTRQSPVFDIMLKTEPWKSKNISSKISENYPNVQRIDSPYFDIWVGDFGSSSKL
ncbi:LA_3751/LA_3752 family putative glycosyltransferase [Leptospira koniambonensis]|uniref:LA_3751/LA_3752 family putative glycosyltransferase n=1 Tax=Leptospira koniambonensis TaxID=2484950 RepID=UPI003EBF6BBE